MAHFCTNYVFFWFEFFRKVVVDHNEKKNGRKYATDGHMTEDNAIFTYILADCYLGKYGLI